jgi:hypothetical protein
MLAPAIRALIFEIKANRAQVAFGCFLKKRVLHDGDGGFPTIVERNPDGSRVLGNPAPQGSWGDGHAAQTFHIGADFFLR